MDDTRLWLFLAGAIASTYVWRAVGVVISGRIDPSGAVFHWFYCVAYGLLAGLVSRMIFLPVGILSETVLSDRLLAVAVGMGLFFALRRNLLLATIGGTAMFIALITWRGF